jgi:glyoxylase-like metal-dependent hydrolase (beta-lactamase superfamily II)/rhodanese-related sulfurtransferase
VGSITADELLAGLDDGDKIVLLDVREPDEFESWSIPGALNVPLSSLEGRLDAIGPGEVVTICAVGTRAAEASEVLARAGRESSVLQGGMGAWSGVYDDAVLEAGHATIVQVRRRGKGCLSYLVGAGGAAAVIDPSSDVEEYVARAEARGWGITHVFDTHLHADHVSGARALAQATGAALVLNPADRFSFEFSPLSDGMRVVIADGVDLTVSVLATPGHTKGSTVFLLGEVAAFTGDTLFLESVGRPDLADQAEAFAHALYGSLHDKLLELGDDAMVLPAHFSSVVTVDRGIVGATIGDLKARLWQLSANEDDFVAWAVGSVADRPPHYVTIVEANLKGTALAIEERASLEAGPNRCAVAG